MPTEKGQSNLEQLKKIATEVNSLKQNTEAKDDDVVLFTDVEGDPQRTLQQIKTAGPITKVTFNNDGKPDLTLNEKFCGTLVCCGDMTSYKINYKSLEEAKGICENGNGMISEVFKELLKKIKKHNENHQQEEKQIKFIVTPGNHDFLGFQGGKDDGKLSLILYEYTEPLENKLRAVQVIAEIQQYFLEQVAKNKAENDIFDDDYDTEPLNIEKKIDELKTYIDEIKDLITKIQNKDQKTMEQIKQDIGNFNRKWKQAELNTTELQELNDLKLEKLHLLQWNKTPLLSKIVFCHKGKKYRALHSYSLFLPKKDNLNEYEEMINAANQQDIFKKTFKNNLVNPDGIEIKVLSDNAVLKYNKIATFTGHAGLKLETYEKAKKKPFGDQNSKIVCADWYPPMMMRVDNDGFLKCYNLQSGKQNKEMTMQMETVSVTKTKKIEEKADKKEEKKAKEEDKKEAENKVIVANSAKNDNINNNDNEQNNINHNNSVQHIEGQVINQNNNVMEENQQQHQIQVQQERKWYYYLNPFNWFKSCCEEPQVIENNRPRTNGNDINNAMNINH